MDKSMKRQRNYQIWPETNSLHGKTSPHSPRITTPLDDNKPIFIKDCDYGSNSSEPTFTTRISSLIDESKNNINNLMHNLEEDNLTDPLKNSAYKSKKLGGRNHDCGNDVERRMRLAKMADYASRRLAKESPLQRAMRLKKMSLYTSRKLATETSEERSIRLAKMSAYTARRLASETPEQRVVRLQRMSAYSARRKALKTKMNSSDSSESLKSDII